MTRIPVQKNFTRAFATAITQVLSSLIRQHRIIYFHINFDHASPPRSNGSTEFFIYVQHREQTMTNNIKISYNTLYYYFF